MMSRSRVRENENACYILEKVEDQGCWKEWILGYPYSGNVIIGADFLSEAVLVWRPASGVVVYQVLLLQPS